MERKRVNSSKLRSVGYDEKTLTLEVELSNGQVYQYPKVYPEVYRRFMAALGIERAVLVQPSIYGQDNRAMLDALREGGGNFRGVVVPRPDLGDADSVAAVAPDLPALADLSRIARSRL